MISYGSQHSNAATPFQDRSHQLGEGLCISAEMPVETHPSRSVYGSQSRYAAMPCNQLLPPVRGGTPVDRSNARRGPSSPPVYGSPCYHAAMPIYDRSHLFTRGQTPVAEMLFENRLSREGSIQHRNNARIDTPFPTSFNQRPIEQRSNAI